jgi:hypothetical protein
MKIRESLIILTMFVLSVLYIQPLNVLAADLTTADGYTYTVDSATNEATITGYTGTDTDITIPSNVDGYKVTEVGLDAFRSNKTVISVNIPGTVKTIGKCAFWMATNLKEVTIESGCNLISTSAFCSCSSLEKVVIPASVTTLEYIDSANEIFDGVNENILRVYLEPESAAEVYINTYESDIKYYYIDKYSPSSIEFINPTLTINVGDTYTFSDSDFTVLPSTSYINMPASLQPAIIVLPILKT